MRTKVMIFTEGGICSGWGKPSGRIRRSRADRRFSRFESRLRKILNRRFNCNVCCRRAFVLSSPAHVAEALAFLNGQEPSNAARAEAACGLCLASARKTVGQRKQRTRRECDSPLPTPVGTENRTFPGRQPLPVLRYQGKSREYFLSLHDYHHDYQVLP